MTDRDPGTSSGDGLEQKAQGAGNTPYSGDLSPYAPDSGIGEAKPHAPIIPQPPIFDQGVLQTIRSNEGIDKLPPGDARLINKFLRENGVDQIEYRGQNAKWKLDKAKEIIDGQITSYFHQADEEAKKKVVQFGLEVKEDFTSPLGDLDGGTPAETMNNNRSEFWRSQDISCIARTEIQLQLAYIRAEGIRALDLYLLYTGKPDLHSLVFKNPTEIITEGALGDLVNDSGADEFLEEEMPVPGDKTYYPSQIKEFQQQVIELIEARPETTSRFSQIREAEEKINLVQFSANDNLQRAKSSLHSIAKVYADRRIHITWPGGVKEDVTDQLKKLKNNGTNNQHTESAADTGSETAGSASVSAHTSEPAPVSGSDPSHNEDPENLRINIRERIQKMKEDSRKRVEKFIETLDQRLRDEIPPEVLQEVLGNAQTSTDDLDTDPLSRILTDLEDKGLRISQDIKNELGEDEQEQVPKIDFVEMLRSFVGDLAKDDPARLHFEKRFGNNLEGISEEEAKEVLINLSKMLNGDEDRPKNETASSNSINLDAEKESIWTRAGKAYARFTKSRGKDSPPISKEEKAAKNRKKLKIVGGVLGIGAVVALTSICIAVNRDSGNGNSGQQASGQDSPTISAISTERAPVLTAQAKATAKAERSATPTVLTSEPTLAPTSERAVAPLSEPTTAPTTTPPENPQNPTPPTQPQGQVKSSDYSHDQAAEALDLTDGVKDGSVDVHINVSGTNFDNTLAQTLGASGLNLINKDNLYENGALRWKWTLLASDGNGEKYHWVNVGDQIRIPADKLADAYRWSNVVVPEKIASQVKLVSTKVENKNESAVIYGNHQEQQAANESDQPVADFSGAENGISSRSLNGEIDVKNLAPNVDVYVASAQEEFQNAKNAEVHIGFTNDIVESSDQLPITQKAQELKYYQSNIKTKKEDQQMRFVAATLYERERQKQLKKLGLKLYSDDDDDQKEDSVLLANI